MTRETKVGLLIGVGVILLIGIILSDHLSVAQRQHPANLADFAPRAQDGLAGETDLDAPDTPSTPDGADTAPEPAADRLAGRVVVPLPDELGGSTQEANEPAMIERREPSQPRELIRAYTLSEQPVPGRASNANPRNASNDANASGSVVTPREGQALANTPVAVNDETGRAGSPTPEAHGTSRNRGRTGLVPRNPEPIVHYVKAEETLYEIAQRYYGDGEYYRSIVEANEGRVMANGHVREGVRLVIPNKAGLANHPDFEPVTSDAPPRQAVAANVIVVQEGETLSSIAERYLGSSGRWRALFEANQHQISAPNQITPGMELELPLTPRSEPGPQKATYVVRSGDSLSGIANRVFGDRSRWDEIYRANRDVLDDPDTLPVGTKLTLPPSE